MRYSWNMAVTAFINGLMDEVAPPIQAIFDEFEDEIMVMNLRSMMILFLLECYRLHHLSTSFIRKTLR